MPNETKQHKLDHIAQWSSDTRPILERFHLELLDVEVKRPTDGNEDEFVRTTSFMDGRMERLMTMTMAVTALGTKLFGGFGEGKNKDKASLDRVKKNADAISAYTMSESLWFASRHLPENHAMMVCLGEGLMAKGGGVEVGSNPQLGFGRIYARDRVARWLESRVVRLLNEPDYTFDDFYSEAKAAHITVWGAAVDTLENTTRFALGKPGGPMTVLHMYDQPLAIARPYEGYMGCLTLPREVVEAAARMSILLDLRTPRRLVMDAIESTYPGIFRRNIHVWTLRGGSREQRIGRIWQEWEALGAHLVKDGDTLPSGGSAFVDSGTYAPTYQVGTWADERGQTHLFLCDGYSATAESIQAATLSTVCNLEASMALLTPRFSYGSEREREIMGLRPEANDFAAQLEDVVGEALNAERVDDYRRFIDDARRAGIPGHGRVLRADDFFPEKRWQTAALVGHICDDPYSGAAGVTKVGRDEYRVTARLATGRGVKTHHFTLRLTDKKEEARLVYSPLLMRFIDGEDYRHRAVKTYDSGRIRNELQTLCSEALEFFGDNGIRVHFAKIPEEALPLPHRNTLLQVLRWYRKKHPAWFEWLDIVAPD